MGESPKWHRELPATAMRAVLAMVICVPLFASLFTLKPAISAPENLPITANAVPGDSLIYAAIDADPASGQYQQALSFAASAGLGDLTGSLAQGFSAALGFDVITAADEVLPAGEIGLAVTGLTITADLSSIFSSIAAGSFDLTSLETTADVVMIIAAIDQGSAVDFAETRLDAFLSDQNLPKRQETFGDVVLEVAGPATAEGKQFAVAVIDEFVIIGNQVTAVQRSVETVRGTVPSLAESEGLGVLLAELPEPAILRLVANGAAIATAVQTSMLSTSAPISLQRVSESVEQIGLSVLVNEEGLRFEAITVPAGGSNDLVSQVDHASAAADKAPSDTRVLASGMDFGDSLSGQLIVALLGSLIGGFFGEMNREVDSVVDLDSQLATAAALLGFNLQEDLIALLEGPFSLVLYGDESANDIDGWFTSSVSRPAILQASLEKLSQLLKLVGLGSATFESVQLGGSEATRITTGSANGTGTMVTYGVVNGAFVLSLGAGIPDFVNADRSSLADSADFKATMALLPDAFEGIFFLDTTILQQPSQADPIDATTVIDSNPVCSIYDDQSSAQSAYEDDPVARFDLDTDFDGLACENFFSTASAAATPVVIEIRPFAPFVMVSYRDSALEYASGILRLREP